MQKLITKLKSFKLAGMVNSLEARMVYANNNSISHSQFLELLCVTPRAIWHHLSHFECVLYKTPRHQIFNFA